MPEDKIITLNPPETGQTIDDNANGDAPAPHTRLTRSEQARINGAKSRGPKTPRGKGVSCMNRLKHGNYMKNPIPILIEDAAYYPQFFDAYLERFKPADPVEHQIVSDIASNDWRLNRLRAFESRAIDTQFRLETTTDGVRQYVLSQATTAYKKLTDTSSLPEHLVRYQESLIRTRGALFRDLDQLRRSYPRHVRTQIPNIYNDIDPEHEPSSNPAGSDTNPPSGSFEPENSTPKDLAA